MTLTVRLPVTLESQLTCFCEAMGVSKSQIVQTALKDWFAKLSPDKAHPLLAFAQAATAAAPSADWAGPYSKERLRARVLASGGAQLACEPAAAYTLAVNPPTTRRRAATQVSKKNSTKPSNNKGSKAKLLKNLDEAGTGVESA